MNTTELIEIAQSGWLRAIDEALVMHDVGVANADDDYATAKDKLNKLLCVVQDIGAYFAKQESAQSAAEPVAWTTTKPERDGVYYVRGYSDFKSTAVVEVKNSEFHGELVCNIHQRNSEEDTDKWSPMSVMDGGFEWLGPLLPYTPPTVSPAIVEQIRQLSSEVRGDQEFLIAYWHAIDDALKLMGVDND